MRRKVVATLRLLAQFTREPLSKDLRVAVARSYSLREAINENFEQTRLLTDGVLFEFGESREQDLVWRSRIRDLQPQVRILFLIRIALWKYRAQLPGFELPPAVNAAQKALDEQSAKLLDCLAEEIDGKTGQQKPDLQKSFERLQDTVQTLNLEQPSSSRHAQINALLHLSSRLTDLSTSLAKQI